MFGMVAASGIQIISRADLIGNRKNLYVIAVGLCVGLIPTMDPNFFKQLPDWTAPFLHNGILLGTVTLVLLNLLLNGFSVATGATLPDTGGAAEFPLVEMEEVKQIQG
jgi:NCS2 family nucleobase:cation symporter-2